MSDRIRKLLIMTLASAALLIISTQSVSAQQSELNEAAEAVVRIRACDASGCGRGVGSGVIIDPSGVILTANHVTLSDPNDPLSPPLRDFMIELTTDARHAPEARYRARLAASDRESDLALLQVYWDEKAGRAAEFHALALPSLSLLNSTDGDSGYVGLGEPLHILGYPLVGGRQINYVKPELSGFLEESLMKVNGALGQGNSGGPALVVRNDEYLVAGIVIRQRDLALGQVGLLRSVEELPGLMWTPTERRGWIKSVEATLSETGESPTLAIDIDMDVMDFAGHNGRVLAYFYDRANGQHWKPKNSSLPTNAHGQVVLSQEFTGTDFIDHLDDITLSASDAAFANAPEGLTFRLVIWDTDEMKSLWRDSIWRGIVAGNGKAVALAPTKSPELTVTLTSTSQPTDRPTKTPVSTATPISTQVPTTKPTETATTFSTPTPAPTLTPTPTAKNTLTSSPIAATPTSPPASAPAGASVIPILPGDLASLRGRQEFSWKSNFQLAPGQAYEVVFWMKGQDAMHDGKGWGGITQTTTLTINWNKVDVAQETYHWGVLLVEADPYRRLKFLGGGYVFSLDDWVDDDFAGKYQ